MRVLCFLLFYARSQLTSNPSSLMQFSITAEDMHAAAAEMNEIYDAQREEARDAQEADHDWATRPHPLFEGDDMSEFDDDQTPAEDGEPRCHDMSDDAEALASAGYGTDEDYGGSLGGEDSYLDSYYESQTECDFGE